MNIREFVADRLGELYFEAEGYPEPMRDRVQALVLAQKKMLEFHEQWPILVEGPLEVTTNFDDYDAGNINHYIMKAARQVTWLTEQEYIKRFGIEAPTTPMLQATAMAWRDHPDFQKEWA